MPSSMRKVKPVPLAISLLFQPWRGASRHAARLSGSCESSRGRWPGIAGLHPHIIDGIVSLSNLRTARERIVLLTPWSVWAMPRVMTTLALSRAFARWGV